MNNIDIFRNTVHDFFQAFCPIENQIFKVTFFDIINAFNQWHLRNYETIKYLYITPYSEANQSNLGTFETFYLTMVDINQDTNIYKNRGYHCKFVDQPDLDNDFNRKRLFNHLQYSLQFFGYFLEQLTFENDGKFYVHIKHSDPVKKIYFPMIILKIITMMVIKILKLK